LCAALEVYKHHPGRHRPNVPEGYLLLSIQLLFK
jgi:hypothetical protein